MAEKKSLDFLFGKKPVRVMDTEAVLICIPHRYPFLLVDKVDIIEEGVYGIGTKCVTVNEPFFAGHFPGKPVMPGVLVLESMAQTCAAMAMSLPAFKNKIAFFMGIDEARFRRPVVPGDVLKLAVHITRLGRAGKGYARAYVDGQLCAEAEQTFLFSDKAGA